MTITDRRMDRLVTKLAPLELAAFIVRQAANGDRAAVEREMGGIPVKQYRPIPDLATTDALKMIGLALFFWASEHWRYRAAFIGALGLAEKAEKRGDGEAAEESSEQVRTALGRLFALDAALESFKALVGLDAAVAERVAGVAPFGSLTDQVLSRLGQLTGRSALELKEAVDLRAVTLLQSFAVVDTEYRTFVESMMCHGLGAP